MNGEFFYALDFLDVLGYHLFALRYKCFGNIYVFGLCFLTLLFSS